MTSAAKPAPPPSATPPSGAGSTRTQSALGNTAAGSSPATPTSAARLAGSWTCTTAAGMALPGETSIQARASRLRTLPTQPGRVEDEHQCYGAWAYLVAPDVHRTKLFGRYEARSGTAAFDSLVAQVMHQDPYRQARRVFWIVDNGSAHSGLRSVRRLRDRYPNLLLVHGPGHASWLNPIEVYFFVLQRKALTPNDSASLDELAVRLHSFERHYRAIANPFDWTFARADLHQLLKRNHPARRATNSTPSRTIRERTYETRVLSKNH